MAPGIKTDVIELIGDSDDDEELALSAPACAKPMTANGGTSRRDRGGRPQVAAIDLTTADDPLRRLDEVFSQREPIGRPRSRKSGLSSKPFNNNKSDPLIIGSSDDETHGLAAKVKDTLPSGSATSVDAAKVLAARTNKSPAKRKRAPENGDRKPGAQLPEKRRRIDGRPSERHPSSTGANKGHNKIPGNITGKIVDALERRKQPSADDISHQSGSDRRTGLVRKQRLLKPGGDLAHPEGTHASADNVVSSPHGNSGDPVGLMSFIDDAVRIILENAERDSVILRGKAIGTGNKKQAQVAVSEPRELPGDASNPSKSISNLPRREAGWQIRGMHPNTSVTTSRGDGVAADQTMATKDLDTVSGAPESPLQEIPAISSRDIFPKSEQNATESIPHSSSQIFPPPRYQSDAPATISRSDTDDPLSGQDALSRNTIDQELSTQPHRRTARENAAGSHLGDDNEENAVDDKLNTAIGAAVPSTPRCASDDVGTTGFSMLPLSRRIEHTVGRYLAEMREDAEYQTKALLRRSRCSKDLAIKENAASGPASCSVAGSIFGRLMPMTMTRSEDMRNGEAIDDAVKVNVETFSSGPSHKKAVKASYLLRPTISSKDSDCKDVPAYTHYVSLKSNFLAPNVLTMNVWPYFGEDHVGQNAFDKIYNVDVEQRKRKLCRLLQAQQAEEYMESALEDLGIAWTDVLRFLLDPAVDVGSDANALKALANRQTFRGEDFPKSSDKWKAVLSKCLAAVSSPDRRSTAAILCDNFQRLAKFPLWHVARRSKEVVEVLQNFDGTSNSTTIAERTCRVCMRFNCFQHGEMRNAEGSDSEPLYESDEATATDLVHPNKVNYRKRVALLTPPSEHDRAESKTAIKKDRRYWDSFAKVEERGPFYPCNHPGRSCDQAQCSCVENNIPCEKTCGCSGSGSCPRRFSGCSCSSFRVRRHGEYICFRDDRCLCYQLGRECDADLCGKCGVCDLLDPFNRYDDDALRGKCHNANIQRGVPRHTLLGESGVHGMGLYAGEQVKVHEFLGEYKGEVITRHEGDRRAAVYELQNLSYLFTLNTEQEVDSTYYGNKTRFINHRPKGGANVYAVIVLVNTVHRIGLFAERHISTGQELFFDYGPTFPDEQLGGKAKANGKESAPHVRNANLTKEFYDVEDSEDEVGNVRARKAPTSGKGRGRPRKVESATGGPGRKGGARPGAGRKPSKLSKLSMSQSAPALGDDGSDPLNAAAGADASEDEDFEPEQSDGEVSNGSSSSDYSDGDEDTDDGEGEGVRRKKRRKRAVQARRGHFHIRQDRGRAQDN